VRYLTCVRNLNLVQSFLKVQTDTRAPSMRTVGMPPTCLFVIEISELNKQWPIYTEDTEIISSSFKYLISMMTLQLIVPFIHLIYTHLFWERVSLCSSGWPRTHGSPALAFQVLRL
jgi:hypothetical protein